jgi:hypothetical protein
MLDQQMITAYRIITLAASAQFILFVEVMKFSIFTLFKEFFFFFFFHVKENE